MRNAKFVKDGKETDHLGLNRLALVSGEKRVGRKTSCAAYNSPPCHFFSKVLSRVGESLKKVLKKVPHI